MTDPESLLRKTRADDILPAPPSSRAIRLHLAAARRLVHERREDEDSREIVRAIVNLARNLGKEAVAEGVETQSQLEMLRNMGCQFGQGFLMSVPLELDAATDLLAEHLRCGDCGHPSGRPRR